MACLAFMVFTHFWMSLLTGVKGYFFVVQICIARLLAWPKMWYAFSPEYIRQKTHTLFLAKCFTVEVVPLLLCFKGDSNVLLEICFLLFCPAFKSASLPSLNRFLDDSCPLLLCQFVNCSAPELHFSTRFCELNASLKFWFRTYPGSRQEEEFTKFSATHQEPVEVLKQNFGLAFSSQKTSWKMELRGTAIHKLAE